MDPQTKAKLYMRQKLATRMYVMLKQMSKSGNVTNQKQIERKRTILYI